MKEVRDTAGSSMLQKTVMKYPSFSVQKGRKNKVLLYQEIRC